MIIHIHILVLRHMYNYTCFLILMLCMHTGTHMQILTCMYAYTCKDVCTWAGLCSICMYVCVHTYACIYACSSS